MKKFARFLILIILVLSSSDSFTQIGVSSSSLYSIGINSSRSKRINGELKIFANRSINNILIETDMFFNFNQSSYHRFSIGVGINLIPFRESDRINAITIPAQLEFFPLQQFKTLSMFFELAPEFIIEDNLYIRSLWGIRYTFGVLE